MTGIAVSECYQCFRCTNGCPVVHSMDMVPHRVIGYIIEGERERVLSARSPWICIQCVTCSVRCPNGIDMARLFETLRRLSAESGMAAVKDGRRFDELVVDSVAKNGRLHEMDAIARYRLGRGEFFEGLAMGLDMMRKGRIGFKAQRIKGFRRLGSIIRTLSRKGGR